MIPVSSRKPLQDNRKKGKTHMPKIYVTVFVETKDRKRIEEVVGQLLEIDGSRRLGDGTGVTFRYNGEKDTQFLKIVSLKNKSVKLLAEFFMRGEAANSSYVYMYENGAESKAVEENHEERSTSGFPPMLVYKVSIAINQCVRWKRFYLEEKTAREVFHKIVKDNRMEDDIFDRFGHLEAIHWSKDGNKREMSVRVDREFLGTSADEISNYAQPYALPELFADRNSKYKVWNFTHEDEDGMQYHRVNFRYEAPADLEEDEAWDCFMQDWEDCDCEPDLDGIVHWKDWKDRSEFVPV